MSLTSVYFDNICYFKDKLSDNNIKILNDEVSSIENNFDKIDANNNQLAGNIAREYFFNDSTTSKIEQILLPYARAYLEHNPIIYGKVDDQTLNSLYLHSSWVNFQSKYEFNPIHDHTGLISFVIWLRIPYTRNDEMQNKSVMYSNTPSAGCFEFLFCDALGTLHKRTLECDKTDESTMLMFSSRLNHCVYPFYTSDDFRVSISGNFTLK